MTTEYDTLPLAKLYLDEFGIPGPAVPLDITLRARKTGVFVRSAPVSDLPHGDAGTAISASVALATGQWGLVPCWVKSLSDAKLRSPKLVNARSETVSTSTNFRDTWLSNQRCIVPMMAFYADDWRNVKGSGKPVRTRITRVDGKPIGVAGLWESWTGSEGDTLVSFALLTVNANNHALMHRYQQPGSEKRMPVILNEGAYSAWLAVRHEKACEFMRAYAANWLTANPVERKGGKYPLL